MDGCGWEEIISTKTKIFHMDEDEASGRQAWTTVYEDEPRQPGEKVMWKVLEIIMWKSQSRSRQFEKACMEDYK